MTMPEDSKNKVDMLNELDWVQLHNDAFGDNGMESFKEKLIRKTKENPLVPLGTIATITALVIGLKSFYVGNLKLSQNMMRARVGAQAFTFLSIVTGFLLTARKQGK